MLARYTVHASRITDYPRGTSYGVYTSPFTGLDTRIVPIYLKFLQLSSSQSSTFITFDENLMIYLVKVTFIKFE